MSVENTAKATARRGLLPKPFASVRNLNTSSVSVKAFFNSVTTAHKQTLTSSKKDKSATSNWENLI